MGLIGTVCLVVIAVVAVADFVTKWTLWFMGRRAQKRMVEKMTALTSFGILVPPQKKAHETESVN